MTIAVVLPNLCIGGDATRIEMHDARNTMH